MIEIGFRTRIILNETGADGAGRLLLAQNRIDDIINAVNGNPPLIELTGTDDYREAPHRMFVNPRMIIRMEEHPIGCYIIADDDPDPKRRLLDLQTGLLYRAAMNHDGRTINGLHCHENTIGEDTCIYDLEDDGDGHLRQTARPVNAMRVLLALPVEEQAALGILAWTNGTIYVPITGGVDGLLTAGGLFRRERPTALEESHSLTMITR